MIMPRRAAQITQAEVARIIRAAKQAGASEVVVKIGNQSVIVRLAWQARSESTRAKWDGIYRQVLQAAGNAPLSAITPKVIRAGLERRSRTPGQAAHFLNAMRALFRGAVKTQLMKADPTAGIEAPVRSRDAGSAGPASAPSSCPKRLRLCGTLL